MPLTEKQHARASEISADVLKRRRELDAMQQAIEELEENLRMARDYRIKAYDEFRVQIAALNELVTTE